MQNAHGSTGLPCGNGRRFFLPEVLRQEIPATKSATNQYRRLLKTTMGETKENNIQQTSEQNLWQEEAAMMHIFSQNRKNNLRTLLSLFKGHYGALAGSVFFFIIKHSPTWVLPIVTANIINAVTDHNGNIIKILILNTILMTAFLAQNVPTNYIHTWLYAKTVRTVEKELREALVCKLQYNTRVIKEIMLSAIHITDGIRIFVTPVMHNINGASPKNIHITNENT